MKYRNTPTTVDGIRFASKLEAKRYSELRLLERAGEITNLERQVVFKCTVNGKLICKYIADFRYFTRNPAAYVVEDTKGIRTALYKLKKKLVEALYPGTIIAEVTR